MTNTAILNTPNDAAPSQDFIWNPEKGFGGERVSVEELIPAIQTSELVGTTFFGVLILRQIFQKHQGIDCFPP